MKQNANIYATIGLFNGIDLNLDKPNVEMEINNILVPVDFSECSKNALKKAIDMATDLKAKLHLVNAVHIHTPHAAVSSTAILESLVADYESQVKQSFEELKAEFIELKEIPHDADRYVTYLTDAIRVEVEEKKIDLIIMGTRGDHEGVDHFIGTNATDVIQATTVPVIIIPEHYINKSIKKIAFATDLKKIGDLGNLEVLSTVAKFYGAEVMCFHVELPPFEISKSEEKQVGILKEKLGELEFSFRTYEADEIEEGIKNFAVKHEVDLLAMIPRRHSLFQRFFNKSMTKTIALDPEIPMLAFHDL